MALSVMVMRPVIPTNTYCNDHPSLGASVWPVSRISWKHDPFGTDLHRPRIHDPSSAGSFGPLQWWGKSRHGCHGGQPIMPRVKAGSDKDDGVPGTLGECKAIVAAAMTVAFAVANRVLYKLALVPLKDYPFFLAQLTTFGYVIVYFTILYFRYRLGIVTNEMLAFPKLRFVVVGALEALGIAAGMAAGANLSGASIPILSQTVMEPLFCHYFSLQPTWFSTFLYYA